MLGRPRFTFCTCFFTLGRNRTRLESRSKGVFQNATPGAKDLLDGDSRSRHRPGQAWLSPVPSVSAHG